MQGEDVPALLVGLQAGSVVAGYRLEAQVGAGGMAVVFRARDEGLDRLVALKVLAPGLAADPAFRRRFIAESRAAAAVDDPHIIPIYEAGEANGVLFIAMRFVGGGDLRGVLDRAGVLPPASAAGFISPVASALDAAHRAGLVHRDVKPANILVDAGGDRPDHVYLSDFGVSKGATSSVSLTGAGPFLGTPDYAAPEQIQGREVDGRADQYALACVAYQLLTGVVPFARDKPMAVLLAHLSEPPPALAARRPGLPAAADPVLARAMAKVPEERYASCTDFADALRQALGLAPRTSPGSLGPFPASDPLRSRAAAPLSMVTSPGPAGSAATSSLDVVPESPPPAGPGHPRGRPRAPGSPRRRQLAALAAAAAVGAAVATLVVGLLTPDGPGDGSEMTPGTSPTGEVMAPGPPGASGTAELPPATTAPTSSPGEASAPDYVVGGLVPRFYVWLGSPGNPNLTPSDAVVRLTASGAPLGTVTPSEPGGTVVAVTGAADDLTFVLEEQPFAGVSSPGANQYFEPRTFYLLRLYPDGRAADVTRLAISEPAGSGANGLALSPDGTKLAIALQPDNVKSEPDLTELQLYSVATGALLRTWTANGTIGMSGNDSEALSWTADGQTLAFSWYGSPGAGERLLDIGQSGTSLLGNSRDALPQSTTGCEGGEDQIITGDGSNIVCGAGGGFGSAFREFSAVTGEPTRTLMLWPGSGQTEVLWSNPDGSVLVGEAPGGGVGIVTNGRFAALPGSVTETYEDQGAW